MLRIENMTFTYSGADGAALNSINLWARPGKLVLLTGPSGSGKSTLLHCINGLAQMHYGGDLQGQVRIAGREIIGKSLWEISELAGTVFQNPNTQFFQLTVEDEITFGLEHLGLSKESIEERLEKALEDVEIESLRYRDIFSLSSGEKQKVAMASILAMEQPLLLLDEPTANLDIESIHELQRILMKLKKQGRTIIISEHRLWYLKEIADQVVVIKDGRVVFDGDSDCLCSASFRDGIGLRIWDQMPDVINSPKPLRQSRTVLNIKNISGGPHKKQIVNDISAAFKTGQCVGVMGHNGAGKTMLSRILTGLQKESSGHILINNEELKPKKRIQRIACVSQQAQQQLFSDTVVGELLMNGNNRDAENTLKQYDLLGLKDRHPQTLSGGEKQRLAIACCLICNPDIIILDEPTSGMDLKRMKMLAVEIEKLCEKGILVLVITHDIELVSLCCDKIVWMEKGAVSNEYQRSQYHDLFRKLMKNEANERPENEMFSSVLK